MSVFKREYSSQYDHLYAEKDYYGECNLIEDAVRRYAIMPITSILDIGCGTGSHSIELASRGYKVSGVDLSQSMLDEASRKSERLSMDQRPSWLCGDVKSFTANTSYDCGIMMFAVVGYLTSNTDVLCGLRNIRAKLNKGAVFICDFWYGPSVIANRPSDRVRVIDTEDGQIIRTSSTELDIARHTAFVTFSLWHVADNKLLTNTKETHHLRYFYPQEFELLLSSSGFKLQSISAFPSLNKKLDDDTLTALVVAQAV